MSTALIPLSQGQFAIVDADLFDELNKWKWHCHVDGYAARQTKTGAIMMHRIILGTPAGLHTDHINGNGLDNRRVNLRVATCSNNQHNAKLRRDNTSGFKGVSFHPKMKKYCARIMSKGKNVWLGTFPDKETAAKARNVAAKNLHGEFMRTH